MRSKQGTSFRWFLTAKFIMFLGFPLFMSGTDEVDRFVLRDFGRWSADGRNFFIKNSHDTLHLISNTKLVMVSFKPYSSFGQQLKENLKTRAYYSSAKSSIGRALIEVSTSEERDQLALAAHENLNVCGVLEEYRPTFQLGSLTDAQSPIIPTSVKSSAIEGLLNQVSASQIENTVSALQNLGSRYHAQSSPNIASDYIFGLWQSHAPSQATVQQVSHASTKNTNQKSVVVTIPASGSSSNETVVLGAHLDSINRSDQNQAPGADDNASGIAALTEILRVMKANNATFTRNIEIHAYAAEEVGLLGSSDIATSYATAGKNVTAMLQLDMIGYSKTPADTKVYIITTDTSPVLVRHLKDLSSVYLSKNWTVGTLSAGTSDHKSWTSNGFHSAFAFEHPVDHNHSIHSSSDTKDLLDFNLASQFTKLALAFASHEAGHTAAVNDSEAAWTSSQATSEKIKIAVFKSTTNGYRIAASVTDDLSSDSIELCKISSGVSKGCQAMNTQGLKVTNKNSKDFYSTEDDLTLATGDIWRVNAYDVKGLLVAMRSIKIEKK